jgi:hypothetical protein
MKKTIKNYWVTPGEILAQDPCDRWNKANVLKWFNGRKKVKLSTILKNDRIPEEDRCWIVECVIYLRFEIDSDWWVFDTISYTVDDYIAAIEL